MSLRFKVEKKKLFFVGLFCPFNKAYQNAKKKIKIKTKKIWKNSFKP